MYFSWTIMFIILFKITSIRRQILSNNLETIMELGHYKIKLLEINFVKFFLIKYMGY